MSSAMRVKGSRIREARLAAGMSQSQLARAIQSTERNIVRWENSKNQPRVESVAAIAEATDRDMSFFLNRGDSEDDDEESDPLAALLAAIRRVVRDEIGKPEQR